MNPLTHTAIWRLAKVGIVMLAALGFSQGAFATLAADHIIRNTVSVDYNDSADVAQTQLTASVDITVRLVAAIPFVSVDPTSIGPVNQGTSQTVTYTVTSNSNGLDNYTLAESYTNGAASTTSITPNPLPLGGTSFASGTPVTFNAAGVPSSTTITVPMDGSANGELSGFQATDTIVFRATGTNGGAIAGDVVCTIASVTEGDPTNNDTATITIVDPCDSGGVARELVDGDQAGERADIVLVLNTGGTDATILLDATITTTGEQTAGGADPAVANAAQVSIIVAAVDLRVHKFVRNITTTANNPTCPAGTGNTDFTCLSIVGGSTYHATGVAADPGDKLEYAILLYNNTSLVKNVQVTDPIVAFTTYDATGTGTGIVIPDSEATDLGNTSSCVTANAGSGTCTIQTVGGTTAATQTTGTDGTGDDWMQFTSTTVAASAGHDGAGAAVGNIAGGQINGIGGDPNVRRASVVIFRVDVDNN